MNKKILLTLYLSLNFFIAIGASSLLPDQEKSLAAQKLLAKESNFEFEMKGLLSAKPRVQIKIQHAPPYDVAPKNIFLKLADEKKPVSLSGLIRHIKNKDSKEFDASKKARIEACIASFFQGDRTLRTFCSTGAIFKPNKNGHPYYFIIFNKPIEVDFEDLEE